MVLENYILRSRSDSKAAAIDLTRWLWLLAELLMAGRNTGSRNYWASAEESLQSGQEAPY